MGALGGFRVFRLVRGSRMFRVLAFRVHCLEFRVGRGVAKNCGFLVGPDYNTYPKIMTPKKSKPLTTPTWGDIES